MQKPKNKRARKPTNRPNNRFGNRNLMQRKRGCLFCEQKSEPAMKDLEILRRFVSDRGKIVSRGRSGVCRKHQKDLGLMIKRARFLSLLPYMAKVR